MRDVSYYAMQLRPYYELFGKDNILPLLFEDLRDDPLKFVQQVYAWLGVCGDYVPENLGQSYNEKPQQIQQVRGRGILRRFRYSRFWSLVGPLVPASIRSIGRRMEVKPVDPKTVSTNKIIEFLRPIQVEQTQELADLTGMSFQRMEDARRAPLTGQSRQ
ncbi:MAG: sulfotransferase [Chromatiales bacterium]|nr:sulfotransferase [Chromatiales bacterium]